jgi:hypothetical protein
MFLPVPHENLFGFADACVAPPFRGQTTLGAGMISRFAVRTFAIVFAITFVAGVQATYGQAVPQLLPYQTSVVAGGGTTPIAAGASCPVSGKTSLDAYGDGCLATEVQLNAPKYVTEDSAGNIYFSDYGNALIRRVDAVTGIITAVAGGGALALPSATVSDAGLACPSNAANVATDFQGDGCLATDVKLSKPTGVAVSPLTGDVVFADAGLYTVRGISKATGQIYNVAGAVTGVTKPTYGYIANNPTLTPAAVINAATASALDAPYGLHFDSVGNLYIAEEYKDAILVVNTSSATTTVTGVSIPAGTIAKVAGYKSATYGAYCPNGVTGTTGCGYGLWVTGVGASANSSFLDNPYDVTTDPSGNVYIANEYAAAIGQVSTAGILNTYAGTQASASITIQRGPATLPFGTPFGIASDSYGNIYMPDSVTGWIWRVDAVGKYMYVLAGAGPLCSTNVDKYGDGCPASGTIFPTGTLKPTAAAPTYASTPGLSGLFVDASGTLLVGNTVGNLVHKITTNANFGTIQNTSPVQNIEIHFGAGDSAPSASAYALTTNPTNFLLGTPACTLNSDTTSDCIVPVTANTAIATTSGPFSSNLHVVSQMGLTNDFTLSGNLLLQQVSSTTALTVSSTNTNPVAPVTLTASVTPSAGATGTITFMSSGAPIGTPQPLVNGGASIQYTFPLGTYSVTADYSGNPNLYSSDSTVTTITSVIPVFNITPNTTSMTVAQGQFGLNSFAITTAGSYTGTVTFACSNLPANTSCSFSPSSLVVGGAGVNSNTVSLNIVTGATNQASLVKPTNSGPGYRMLLACLMPGAAGIVLLGFGRKKRSRLPIGVLLIGIVLLVAGFSGCASNQPRAAVTPAGTYTVMVTATGTPNVLSTSTNIVQTSSLTLTVTSY